MVQYTCYTNCIKLTTKGKYFGKKCFLSFPIPLWSGICVATYVRETFFRCVPRGALFDFGRAMMENTIEKIIIMGEEWDRENLEWFKKALIEGINRRLDRELNSDKESNE